MRSTAATAKRMLRRVGGANRIAICPDPVFVLGNQKSGTSAIAALLASHCGLKATIDLRREIGEQLLHQVRSGRSTIDELIERNAADFSSPIIKHPNLTFVYPQLRERFPSASFVFVVRDPHQNIRSILDRLGLPGDRTRLEPEEWSGLTEAWRLILSGDGVDRPRPSHIDALAERWNLAAACYLANPADMALIRYEDFMADKAGSIGRLAASMGMTGTVDIAHLVDRQFQPAGVNRGVEPLDFFGPEVFSRISELCAAAMVALGYGVEPSG